MDKNIHKEKIIGDGNSKKYSNRLEVITTKGFRFISPKEKIEDEISVTTFNVFAGKKFITKETIITNKINTGIDEKGFSLY